MIETLRVETVHRATCVFGTGFFRLYLLDGGVRYCQSEGDVERAARLLGKLLTRVERDGYCLDGDRDGDANTPDVVDAAAWLALERQAAMDMVGLESEADYRRVYEQIEQAVLRRDNRASQGGVRASIVIKKRGRAVQDI